MKIESLTVNFETLELVVRFENSHDLRATADKIMNSNTADKIMNSNTVSKEEMDAQIKRFLNGGQLVNAIKYHRGITGFGLKESKDYVDKFRNTKFFP